MPSAGAVWVYAFSERGVLLLVGGVRWYGSKQKGGVACNKQRCVVVVVAGKREMHCSSQSSE